MLFPIIIFFVVYGISNIFTATACLMLASLLGIVVRWLASRPLHARQWMECLLIWVFGSATLFLKNPLFIQWKVTLVYGIFATVLLCSTQTRFSVFEHMLSQKLSLPSRLWRQLDAAWGLFFLLIGVCNWYVMYHYSTRTWVHFKLFGVMGMTLLFTVAQGFFLHKYADVPSAVKRA